MTINLLTNSEGKKMGKTQSGAVWLDENKTTPYDFFQYWRNIDDKDVMKCIKMLTFIPLAEIKKMEKWEGAKLNEAKEILAYELTKLIHGEEKAEAAKEASHNVFSSGSAENMPSIKLSEDDFTDGEIDIRKLLSSVGFVGSLSEGKRAVEQGGVSVNGEKVDDAFKKYTKDSFKKEFIIKKGKKKFARIEL